MRSECRIVKNACSHASALKGVNVVVAEYFVVRTIEQWAGME